MANPVQAENATWLTNELLARLTRKIRNGRGNADAVALLADAVALGADGPITQTERRVRRIFTETPPIVPFPAPLA